MEKRLTALEAERSHFVVAGLTGSSAGLLVAFLFDRLFGVGLLWRHRERSAKDPHSFSP
jgi:hypothetical protein